jgi:DNA helicase HerA-like ATPase
LLLDLEDLRSLLAWMSDNARTCAVMATFPRRPSARSAQPPGAGGAGCRSILRRTCARPARSDARRFSGRGVVSILDATRLLREAPRVYAAFLIWLLSELFEDLPEVGDADKPKLVLFFDEAHLLFGGAPKSLVDKIEQVVRLIRSKGVGVYFVTQTPLDLPDDVLGQLGLKVQHALRAFTPADRKVIKAVAQSFRGAPGLDVETAVTELERGEALVSTLDAKGAPTPVARTLIRPPESRIGPLEESERQELMNRSPVAGRYDERVDRESAHEKLAERALQRTEVEPTSVRKPAAKKEPVERRRLPGRTGRRRRSDVQERGARR